MTTDTCPHCPILKTALCCATAMAYRALADRGVYVLAPDVVNAVDRYLRATPGRVAANEGRVRVVEEAVRCL